MKKNDGKKTSCCKDEHKFIKNDTDQKVVESSFQLMQIAGAALLTGYSELSLLHIPSVTEENPVSNAPPRDYGVAVYIFNRTLLILKNVVCYKRAIHLPGYWHFRMPYSAIFFNTY
jgi:hypothetical protein